MVIKPIAKAILPEGLPEASDTAVSPPVSPPEPGTSLFPLYSLYLHGWQQLSQENPSYTYFLLLQPTTSTDFKCMHTYPQH